VVENGRSLVREGPEDPDPALVGVEVDEAEYGTLRRASLCSRRDGESGNDGRASHDMGEHA
jgi:hypothetical protein